mmetsp:Transcript_122660/g.212653  ORF Transcript_122660/g.212653 Transcript_122660/m.212653 type:complete len:99 (+) Transcript_122660:272-568(+)
MVEKALVLDAREVDPLLPNRGRSPFWSTDGSEWQPMRLLLTLPLNQSWPSSSVLPHSEPWQQFLATSSAPVRQKISQAFLQDMSNTQHWGRELGSPRC